MRPTTNVRRATLKTFIRLGGISLVMYVLTWYLQENAYGRPNTLFFVENALNNQVVATSFFVNLFVGCMCFLVLKLTEIAVNSRLGIFATLGSTAILSVYATYEVVQMINPAYYDNNIGDMICSLIAILLCFCIWLYFWHLERNTPKE